VSNTAHYAKPSNNSSNFSLVSTSFMGVRVKPSNSIDLNGNLWSINTDGSELEKLDKSTGVVSTLFTGLTSVGGCTLFITSSDNIVINFVIDAASVGGSAGDKVPAIAVFDGISSSSIIYYDDVSFIDAFSTNDIQAGTMLEVTPGTVIFSSARFGVSGSGGASRVKTYFYALSGL
jgi:hypothetical protein